VCGLKWNIQSICGNSSRPEFSSGVEEGGSLPGSMGEDLWPYFLQMYEVHIEDTGRFPGKNKVYIRRSFICRRAGKSPAVMTLHAPC